MEISPVRRINTQCYAAGDRGSGAVATTTTNVLIIVTLHNCGIQREELIALNRIRNGISHPVAVDDSSTRRVRIAL